MINDKTAAMARWETDRVANEMAYASSFDGIVEKHIDEICKCINETIARGRYHLEYMWYVENKLMENRIRNYFTKLDYKVNIKRVEVEEGVFRRRIIIDW